MILSPPASRREMSMMRFILLQSKGIWTAATQGHIEVVTFLLESGGGLANIARSNGKTALHAAARNGHVEVVKALLQQDPGITRRTDKKGQTALHMAVKGQNLEVVVELIKADPISLNLADTKGNTPLHVATRKGRGQVFDFVAAEYETPKNSLNQEYNVRPSAGNEKNYFIGRFGSGLPTFGTKKKSSDTRWTLQKEGLQGREVTDTLKV